MTLSASRWLHALWLAALVGPQPALQSNRRLSDLPGTGIGGDVADALLAPVGARVVFRADPHEEGVYRLFSAPVDGSASPVELSGAPGMRIQSGYQISPDGLRVVYLADADTRDVFELYSVAIDGSAAPVKLSGTMAEGGDVRTGFRIAPDGTRVVYTADWLNDTDYLLISVQIDGSSGPVIINGPFVAGSDVEPDFRISSDGTRVVYSSDEDTNGVLELFSTSIASSAPIKLNAPLPVGGDVLEFELAPDGSQVVYRADQDVDGLNELFSVPIDASASPAQLNGVLVSGGAVQPSFAISPDGDAVVYLADEVLDEKFELFSAPIDASVASIKVSGTMVPTGDVANASGAFAVTPDSAQVVFVADKDINNLDELFVGPLDASAEPIQLNDTLGVGGDVVLPFRISPTGARVVYSADRNSDELFELFSAPISGGTVVQLNGPLVAGGDVDTSPNGFRIGPGGNRVIYRADQDTDGVNELYVVPIDASAGADKLNDPLVAGGAVTAFQFNVNGGRVLYVADQDADEMFELHSVPSNGSSGPEKVNDPFPFDLVFRDVLAFHATDRRAVFLADRDDEGVFELYSVPARGGATVELSGPMASGGDALQFEVAVAGSRVVYTADQDVDEEVELFSVPEDGSAAPVQLSDSLVAGGDVTSFDALSNGPRVVYLADQTTDETFELYSAPADGSASAVQLSGPLVADGDVLSYRISPGGSRVVYRADQEIDGTIELFSVPIDGSASPVKLNPPSGSVESFEISSDGGTVVFRLGLDLFSVPADGSASAIPLDLGGDVYAITPDGTRVLSIVDREVIGRMELFSVPIDASASPVKVNTTPAPGGEVVHFVIASDSSRVVYLADQELNQVFELYSASANGSGSPVKLNGGLSPTGDVLNAPPYSITPDSARVLYVARGHFPAGLPQALYSVPIDGSAAPIMLNGTLVPDGDVVELAISQDGNLAVYRADQISDSVDELFGVPVDGSAPAVKLNGPLLFNGDVHPGFEVRADGRSVFYLADQRANDAVELFVTFETRVLPQVGPTRTAEKTQ